MKSIFEQIKDLNQEKWDYYYQIDPKRPLHNPFKTSEYSSFIKQYFYKSGKGELLENCGLDFEQTQFTSHICSVFFFGLIVYYNTIFYDKIQLGKNKPGYQTFVFIWFLTTLFHDGANQIELQKDKFPRFKSLEDLYDFFDIEHKLLNLKTEDNNLYKFRIDYYNFRQNTCQKTDHGILAGILLYDRLTKIRKYKVQEQLNDSLHWGKDLVKQYELAANLISIHNIWIPDNNSRIATYKENGLSELVDFKPISYKEYPLFYILGIVDTIDPIKAFKSEVDNEFEILDSILISFKKSSITLANKESSNLNFKRLIERAINLYGWLDVEVVYSDNRLTIKFK